MLFFTIRKDCLGYTHDLLQEECAHQDNIEALKANYQQFSFYLNIFLAIYDCEDLSELRDLIAFLQVAPSTEALGESLWDLFKMDMAAEMPEMNIRIQHETEFSDCSDGSSIGMDI